MAPDIYLRPREFQRLRGIDYCHCYWLKLLEGSLDLQIRPCHTLLQTIPAGSWWPAEACCSQCAMLLLTSIPSPRCPACPECPPPASHPANSSFKTLLRGLLQETLPYLPGWVRCSLCVSITELTIYSVSSAHVCVRHWTVFPPRARASSFCPFLLTTSWPDAITENVFWSIR